MAQATFQPRAFTAGPATSLNLPSTSGQHDKILVQAEKWVAQTFFGTLLKQVRDSPFKSKLFDGGRGGQAFGALYDQRLAEHMARGSGHKLVNAIARRIEANQAYKKSQAFKESQAFKDSGTFKKSRAIKASQGNIKSIRSPASEADPDPGFQSPHLRSSYVPATLRA